MTPFDRLFRAYVACALWSSSDDGTSLDNLGPDALAPETREAMRADCEAFLTQCGATIEACQGRLAHRHDNAFAQAGHDLWLTRNGHGAGFWDGDWPEPESSTLDEAAKAMGAIDLYVGDDGRIYH